MKSDSDELVRRARHEWQAHKSVHGSMPKAGNVRFNV